MPSAAAWSVVVLSCALGACSVYGEGLLDAEGALDGDAGGTKSSGGSTVGSGGSSGKFTNDGSTGGKSGAGMAGSGAASSNGSGGDGELPGSGATGGEGASGNAGNEAGADSGGSSSSGGGTGGTPPVTSTGDLLDGFEDEDLTLEQSSGRGGVWYLFDDGTAGKAGPAPLTVSALLDDAPAALGAFAMHITASGFTSWGSGLGVDFRAGKKVYDGSKHSGIRFWARVGEGKNTRHRLQIADGTTDKLGGKCNPAVDAPEGEKCDDHFGTNQTFTTTWTEYAIPFADLSQIGWGNAADELDKSTLYGLQITAKAKLDVDLWLDQIEFF